MDFLNIWNTLSYFDGFMFTVWIAILYYGKCRIDNLFQRNKNCSHKGKNE